MDVSQKKKKKEIVIKKANDHWAFLDDIEAPMWADLTVVDKSGYVQINGDEWFNTTHPFHQWSARALKSKFAHSCDEVVTLGVDSRGLASPLLPSSVSKSRGKHYNHKNWEGINLNVLLDKQEGLGRRGAQPGFLFGREIPKSKPNVRRPNGILSAKLGSSFQHSAKGNTMSVASCSNLVSSSSSIGKYKMGESTTRSTITSENTLQQQDYKEVSSRQCNEKGKSSSVTSVSFGRNCVTRKASRNQQQKKHVYVSSQPFDQNSGNSSVTTSVNHRKINATQKSSNVEMDVDSMKSRGRKSSSGKSSVGSCSNLRDEVSKQMSEKISEKKREVTMNLANKNRSKISAIGVDGKRIGKRMGSNIRFEKPTCNTTTKPLVKTQSSSRDTLPRKINKNNSSAGVKEKLGKGKENAARNVAPNQNCNEKSVPAGYVLRSQSTTQHSRLQKANIAGIAASTKLGKVKDQPETKSPSKPARRIYLR